MIGQTIAHYRILEKLGEGGMGVVYKAHDTDLDRDVALKFLPHHTTASEAEQARFLQEARAAALLNHPHICTVHAIERCGDEQFIVMEYVEGKTLGEKNQEGSSGQGSGVRYADAITYAFQIAEALQEAHCHGIVHRDIKGDNIMVTGKNQVKVMDFGLAKLKGSLHLTRTSSTIGTLAYMSPEQIEGKEVDARTDIFSLGILLYEMLTGHLPFRGEHEAAMMYSIVNEEPTAIRKYIPEISSELERILGRALEKDPIDRYQHVDDMASDLRRLGKTTSKVTGLEMLSLSPIAETRSTARRWVQSLDLLSTKAAFIIAGLVIVAGASYFIFFRPTAQLVGNRVAVTPFENQAGDPALETYGTLISESVGQGLTAIADVDVVPASEAIRVWDQLKSGPEHIDAIAPFVRQTGAKLVITGAYYKQGDSLLIHARVTDAETGRNVKVMQAIGCTVEKRMLALDHVRQRLLGAIAFEFDPWAPAYAESPSYFPTFDAYREFKAGNDMFMRNRMAESVSHFRKSLDLDPTFQAPLGLMALAQMNLAQMNSGNFTVADSLVHCLDDLRPTLATMDLLLLNWLQAFLRGDNVSCLEIGREGSKRFPGQPLSTYEWGLDALKNNRPHEAMAAFSRLDTSNTTSFREWVSTWGAKTHALHLMGDHEQELREAGKGRRHLPDRIGMIMFEMRALAALGRIDDIWKRYEEARAFPQGGGTVAGIMVFCATELRYHGFAEASRQAADKAIDWCLSRSDSEQQGQVWQNALAQSYYVAGRFADAQGIGRRLLQQNPENMEYQGFVGAIAARLGDTTEARRIDSVLKENGSPYLFGSHTYGRARIAALLGEKDRAVTLLRDALSQGLQGKGYARLHADMDLEGLKDYPPFQELVKPKD